MRIADVLLKAWVSCGFALHKPVQVDKRRTGTPPVRHFFPSKQRVAAVFGRGSGSALVHGLTACGDLGHPSDAASSAEAARPGCPLQADLAGSPVLAGCGHPTVQPLALERCGHRRASRHRACSVQPVRYSGLGLMDPHHAHDPPSSCLGNCILAARLDPERLARLGFPHRVVWAVNAAWRAQ